MTNRPDTCDAGPRKRRRRSESGSSLPPGLSLDTNTGLVYGTLVGMSNGTSIIAYTDGSGASHGTVTINWTTVASDFGLNSTFQEGILGTSYPTSSPFATIGPASSDLTNALLVYGALPEGLAIEVDPGNSLQAIIYGTPTEAGYFDAWFQITTCGQNSYIYKRVVVSHPTALAITTPSPLPNATVGVSYTTQMHAVGGSGGPYTWKIAPDPNSITPGILFSAVDPTYGTGAFSGSAAASHVAQNYTITVNDGITTTFDTFSLTVQASGLVITPHADLTVISGSPFTLSPLLVASGSGNTPYTWSISPASLNNLPTGLTLANASTTTASITGTTNLTGFNAPVIFRVTDSIGAYADITLQVTVAAGLALKTGVDYADSVNTGLLGYIDNGNTTSVNPRPNSSFFVVATGVVSVLPANITVTTNNPGITGTVTSLDTVNHIAFIQLSGSFNGATPGTYNVSVTVVDSGVSVTTTFSWVVYDDGVLRLSPGSGSFPTQLV